MKHGRPRMDLSTVAGDGRVVGILRALALLAKGSAVREILNAPFRALRKHILLPAGVVWFFTFLHIDVTARGGWPMLAVAGAIWLLFANSLTQAGMAPWHERWLLRDGRVPAWLLLTSAALVPIALFGTHISLILALRPPPVPRDGDLAALVSAGGIAMATGIGLGLLVARLAGFRPNLVSALSKLLLASLILTPVFYHPSSLEALGQAWCIVNPLCAATELARSGLSLEVPPLARYAKIISCSLSGTILCVGLFTLRLPSSAFAAEHD